MKMLSVYNFIRFGSVYQKTRVGMNHKGQPDDVIENSNKFRCTYFDIILSLKIN